MRPMRTSGQTRHRRESGDALRSISTGSVNRNQVKDGARILAFLVPLFIDIMMDNPRVDWGAPYYPVVE